MVPRDKEAFNQLLTTVVPRCHELLLEENLWLTGIILSGDMRLPAHVLRRAAVKRKRAINDAKGSEKRPRSRSSTQSLILFPTPLVRKPWEDREPIPFVDLTANTPSKERRVEVVLLHVEPTTSAMELKEAKRQAVTELENARVAEEKLDAAKATISTQDLRIDAFTIEVKAAKQWANNAKEIG